jgi:hypothetical protein
MSLNTEPGCHVSESGSLLRIERARAADPAVIEEAYRTVRGVHDDGIAEQVIDDTGPLLGRQLPQYGDRDLRADPSHDLFSQLPASKPRLNSIFSPTLQ